jgi:hypothetical protein
MWQYPRYVEIITQFRMHYGLGEFGFKELDKFLWLYGQTVFRPRPDTQVNPDFKSQP